MGCLALTHPAAAQRVPASDLMPPPKAAPRTPVKSEKLADTTVREYKGQGLAQDSATISLQTFDGRTYDLRLAGLVQAPLTDAKGIAARVALDNLMQARTLTCTRRDRAPDNKIIVTCRRDDGIDLGMQMLRDGAVIFTRSGALSDDFIRAYREAEAMAQAERRGLWAQVPRVATAAVTANRTASAKPSNALDDTVTVAEKPSVTASEKQAANTTSNTATTTAATTATTQAASAVTSDVLGDLPIAAPPPAKASPVAASTENYAENNAGQISAASATLPIAAAAMPPSTPLPFATPVEVTDTMGFFFAAALIGTLLLGISLFDFLNRRRVRYAHEWETKQTRQFVAAALSGELAAARDVCDSRARSIRQGAAPAWPRLRSYVYQTHVDRIGMLGPFLARQVATIYGQMADYSANKDEAVFADNEAMVKSLQRLSSYIEVALEGLAEVEMTGEAPLPAIPADYQATMQAAQHQRIMEARERRAIAHQQPRYSAAADDGYYHDEPRQRAARPVTHAPAQAAAQPAAQNARRAMQNQAPTERMPAERAPHNAAKNATRKHAPSTADYPSYGEVAAQRIMEDELIRRRAEELMKAKASPMKRRSMPPKEAFVDDADLHQPDLLGLDEETLYAEAVEQKRSAKPRRA